MHAYFYPKRLASSDEILKVHIYQNALPKTQYHELYMTI